MEWLAYITTIAANSSGVDLKELGVGGAIAVVLVGMVLRFLSLRKEHKTPPVNGVKSGDRSTDYWSVTIAKIMQDCIDDRVVKLIKESHEERSQEFRELREILRRIEILLERRRAAR